VQFKKQSYTLSQPNNKGKVSAITTKYPISRNIRLLLLRNQNHNHKRRSSN